VNPVTGVKMPARLLMPDPGFANNPGKTYWGGIVDASEKPGKWETLPGLKTAATYGRPALKDIQPADIRALSASLLPARKGDDFYKTEFIKRYGEEKVVTDAAGEPVILSLRSFMAGKTPNAETWKFSKPGHGESIPLMEDILKSPYEIWLTPQKNNRGQIRLTKRYIGLWIKDKEKIGGLSIYEVIDGVFQGVTHFIPMKKGTEIPHLNNVERQRAGLLLYKKGR
jgi:hypothetical protein